MTNIPFETVIEKLYNDRVLLVGGGGFIGHNLALELRRNDITTMVVDNMMVNSCLLYTSPSPRDRTRSRMPSSA